MKLYETYMELIDIKDISGNILLTTKIDEGCKRKFTLQKEDYILLNFSLCNPIYFKLGDYVDCDFGRFDVCNLQKPIYNTSTEGYDYELRLDAYYWKWKNKIFKYTPETAGQEASWNLTAPLDVQAGIVLRNLKVLGYKYNGQDFDFSIDKTVKNKSMLMSYDNINILDACFEMAKKWNCECWVTENIIHFGRCEFGEPVDFEIGVNVEEMTRSDSQSTYATRIYAFGSTRNIPANYRPVDESMVINGVVQRRLMLPAGIPYIDAYPNIRTEEAIEQVVIFDDIYPRRIGTISDITIYEYTDTIENADGTTTEDKWNAYRFKDTGIVFSEEYVLAGEELKITFQSGKLTGMSFAVIFNPYDKDGGEVPIPEKNDDGTWNPNAQVWEIVRNENYGRKLPGDVLTPSNGDTYVLSGWDSTKISELGLVVAAENELKAEVEKYVSKSKIDPNTYINKMMSDVIYDDSGLHNLLSLGDRVNLINKAFFETSRQSRIIGFEFNLDYPFDSPVYTVGETATYSRIGELEEKIDSATLAGQTYTGGNGSGVYIIKRNDFTPATDSNVFSSLRSLSEFISKKKDDIVRGTITFLKGIKIGKYIPGWIGSGAAIIIDSKTGKTKLEVDEVLARDRFETMEFRFNRIDVIDGEQWSTFAFGKIKSVDLENQIVYLDLVDGELMSSHVNDLCRGIFHNLNGVNATVNKMDDCGFYTMAGFSTSYFTPTEILSDGSGFKYSLRPMTTQHPCAEMKFAAYGNLTDPERRMTRVTNTRHTLYLKDVATWQIDPDLHYGAAYGDLTGIIINGVEFNGYSSFQTNGYFKGHIEFLPDQVEDLKGDGGYAVSLTSYDAIVAVDSQGCIDSSLYDILNVVDGEEKVQTGGSQVVVTRYKIQTKIQAFKGDKMLSYNTTPGDGQYSASFSPIGCEYSFAEGILTITKITQDKASVEIEVNCEGKALFTKTFILTRVYGGIDADWTSYAFKQSQDKPATPVSTAVIPDGWSDGPTAEGRWWMSKSTISGITGLAGEWSEPVQVTAEDGGDTDFKYSKNNSETIAPSINVSDRYPSGWTDAPPTLGTGEFLWMSKAKINPDNTLNGSWSTPVRISGEKGYAGDWTSYVFKKADSKPATPTGTDPNPSGWEDGPGTTGKWWMSKSTVNGITGEARDWSVPIQVTGQDGNGMYYEYAVNSSQTASPSSGWSTAVPSVGSGQYLWMRWGQVIPPAALPSRWDGVARVTGEKGEKGNPGNDGDGVKIVYRYSMTKPSRPSGLYPSGWATSPDKDVISFSHGSTFSYDSGFYVSPAIGNGGITKNRISFLTSKANQVVAIDLHVSSENNYDYALVGKLDNNNLTINSNYTDRISGTTSRIIYVDVPVAGSHYIDVAYAKDSSNVAGDDRCMYRIINVEVCWMSTATLVAGSFGGWSDPTRFINDTPDTESIYIRSATGSTPATPYSDPYQNDYVPVAKDTDGNAISPNWTDNPSGANATYPYEFVSIRKKQNGIWGSFSRPAVFVKYGEDANLLDWVKEWDGTKTLISGESVISPKAYFGSVSNGKLATGVLIGSDVYQKGKSGIYGLKNDQLVFKLDTDGNNIIGGWSIENNALSCSSSGEAEINVELTNAVGDVLEYMYINNPTRHMIDIKAYDCMKLTSLGSSGLEITSNAVSPSVYALKVEGGVSIKQRVSANSRDVFDVPGVLAIYRKVNKGQSAAYARIWGDGCAITKGEHLGDSKFKYTHDLNHLYYTIHATIITSENYYSFAKLLEKTSSYFVVQLIGASGKPDDPPFEFTIFGKNK